MNRPYEIISILCASRSRSDVNLGFIEISTAVNEMVEQGYAPVGGITAINNDNFSVTLFQAVYKEHKETGSIDTDYLYKEEPPQIPPAKKRGRPAKN